MKLEQTTTEEHKQMIHETVDAALHGASRNQVGLALMGNAYSFACLAAPDSDFETQVCLAIQLVADSLKDAEEQPEVMSFIQYLESDQQAVVQ